MRRAIAISILAAASLQLLAGPALAGPEWCDDGSPPPNDFGFRPTGSGSIVSSTAWVKSTSWLGTTFDRNNDLSSLSGGVVIGMHEAIDHAKGR